MSAVRFSSSQLGHRYGVSADKLLVWERIGWVRSEGRHGSGSRCAWPGWVDRMVALITLDQVARGEQRRERSDLLCRVARGLAAHPDAVWFVDTGDAVVSVSTAAEAVALAAEQPGPARTIVSPPRGMLASR